MRSPARHDPRRLLPAAVATTALLAVLALAGCSDYSVAAAPRPNPASPQHTARPSAGSPADPASRTAQASARPNARSTTGGSAASRPDEPGRPNAKPSLPPDPAAPARIRPVRRLGGVAHPMTASSASFDTTLRWSDRLTLRVVKITHGVTDGRDAGATRGAPVTTLWLRLTNGSTRPVDVSQVVLTATYGAGTKKVASVVYDGNSADFTGRVAPHRETTAVYSYSIPYEQLSAVSLTVDLDGKHGLGSFSGPVR